MIIELQINEKTYNANLAEGKSIAISLLPNDAQPNHFSAPIAKTETFIAGDFIGDTKRGGSCNVNTLTIVPHCNGTHTESVSHIINDLYAVHQVVKNSFFPCHVISIQPQNGAKAHDNYHAGIDAENEIITKQQLKLHLEDIVPEQLQGLVIRTLPNNPIKKSQRYDDVHYPPFLTADAMSYLVEKKIQHLFVDIPSVDKMYDHGVLENHRIFWGINLSETKTNCNSQINKTITEMVFVDQLIKDGLYLCNLQLPEINTDAVPSRPVLYSLREIIN